ncbi:Arabinose 5-phosphate isomerase KdsD [Planctomycetales bacterium 10988]|nr:Arabinose 5-phosphate isomerase KdsD [Planctomycetales bacterium 10988]
MERDLLSSTTPKTPLAQWHLGREVVLREAKALYNLAESWPQEFSQAIELLLRCGGPQAPGCVLVTGMGKAGLVGQKLVATLASTGTRSHFLHPGEAFHGDLGRIGSKDVVLALSHSGETEELVRILPTLKRWQTPLIAITAKESSTLGQAANVVIPLGKLEEACPLGLAPSTSTTVMLAVGDALALVASRCLAFTPEDFAEFHPGGSLGRKLSHVEEQMRPIHACRTAEERFTVREMLVQVSRPGRRSGAVIILNDTGKLAGILTDSDLARLLESRPDEALDLTLQEVMTSQPIIITTGQPLRHALQIFAERKISELPVLDEEGRPLGVLDVTDLVGLIPQEQQQADSPSTPLTISLEHRKSA